MYTQKEKEERQFRYRLALLRGKQSNSLSVILALISTSIVFFSASGFAPSDLTTWILYGIGMIATAIAYGLIYTTGVEIRAEKESIEAVFIDSIEIADND